jgi:hypothetical protein
MMQAVAQSLPAQQAQCGHHASIFQDRQLEWYVVSRAQFGSFVKRRHQHVRAG